MAGINTQGSGVISIKDLQTVFGGANPISFGEYYKDAYTVYTKDVSGIPNIGSPISLSQFYNKTSGLYLARNVAANMVTSGGSYFISNKTDDSFSGIGVVGTFFWFGIDWGSSNNVQWCTNSGLTFGGGSNFYSPWAPSTARGVLLGQADRMTRWGYQYNPYTFGDHTIKRFIVSQTDYANQNAVVEYEIRLIRGPKFQFIEIRFGEFTSGGGQWNISDGASFYNVFSATPPVGAYESLLLKGDLNGYNWQVFNNYTVTFWYAMS